jgi:thiol-disulfide isomerase/thioredoxin
MMNKIFISIIIIFISFETPLYSQDRSINFITKPWDEVLQMSKDQNKMIFMDAFATWCSPCKWMSANIFTNDTVADYYNDKFICVQIDMEKGEGLSLRKNYGVVAYPTLLFINADGVAVHRHVGASRKVKDYIDLAENALDSTEQLLTYLTAFNSQTLPSEKMPTFFVRLKDAYIPTGPVFNQYFGRLSEKDKLSRSTWEMIKKYTDDLNSPVISYVIGNETDYNRLYTGDSVFTTIAGLFSDKMIRKLRKTALPADSFALMKSDFRKRGYSQTSKLFFIADLTYYQYNADTQAFLALAYEDTDKYNLNDPYILNNIAVYVSQNSTDPEFIRKAVKWSKHSIELDNSANNNLTCANLLSLTGNRAEALQYAKAALQLAKAANMSTKVFEEAVQNLEQQQ